MSDLVQKTLQRTFAHYDIALPADILTDVSAPVRLGVLLDRTIKAKNTLEITYQWGVFDFRPADYILYKNDESIRLTEKETALLEMIVQAKGKAVKRDILLKHVWQYAPDVETHTLETHIYRLRQKIEDDPANPALVMTEGDGDGYRLEGL